MASTQALLVIEDETKPEHSDENQHLIEKIFEEVDGPDTCAEPVDMRDRRAARSPGVKAAAGL